jgi:hypothetical protein
MEIREVLRANDGKASAEYSANSTPALHKITAENLDCVLGWRSTPRHGSIELDVGELFDMLEEIKLNPEWSFVSAFNGAISVYVSDADKWKPPEVPQFSITCPSCKQTFELDELADPAPPDNVQGTAKRAYAGRR